MQTIGGTNVHYIRCIKPNEAKQAWKFEGPMVLSQLQACGVLETVKISCAGYPTRWTYEEFASRYYMLIHSEELKHGTIRDVGLKILWKTVPPDGHPQENQKDGKDKYQLGMSKIFFRAGMVCFAFSFSHLPVNPFRAGTVLNSVFFLLFYHMRYSWRS